MSKKIVQLEPTYLLDEKWKFSIPVSDLHRHALEKYDDLDIDFSLYCLDDVGESVGGAIWDKLADLILGGGTSADLETEKLIELWDDLETEEEKLIGLIRSNRIEVAEAAETKKIGSDGKYDYLKSEIGMNIILPRGSIAEMRFYINLIAEGDVVAIDGFPKDVIGETEIVGGKIKVGISKAFKLMPAVGPYIGELLKIELNPWEFKLGSLKKINIDFSGGLTSKLEWYFKEDGIKNDLRVALTIRKPKSIENIDGKVLAAWLYDPGFLKKTRVGTDAKTIKIYEKT